MSSSHRRILPFLALIVLIGAALVVQQKESGNLDRLFNRTASTTNISYSTGQLQSDVQKVVATYQPIAVSIVETRDVQVLKRCTGGLPFFLDPFGSTGRSCTYENQTQQVGGGSGFIVGADGIIMTNKHVVADETSEYTVIFNDQKEEKAVKIYRDPNTDAALIKVNRTGLTAATLGDSDSVQIGQFIVVIGNALGEYANSASFGIISGVGRSIVASNGSSRSEELEKVFQTDAAINPGNSGGPMINLNGEVIGINTAKVQGAENIGFALPINTVKSLLQNF